MVALAKRLTPSAIGAKLAELKTCEKRSGAQRLAMRRAMLVPNLGPEDETHYCGLEDFASEPGALVFRILHRMTWRDPLHLSYGSRTL